MSKALSLLFLCGVVACSSSSSKPAEGEEHEHEGKHEHEHHEMSGAVKGFHDVLAPIYHEAKSPARNDKACGAVASFEEKATAVSAEAGEAKKKSAEALATAVGDLKTACGADGKPDVEAKIEKLHDAFHAVMEGH